MTEGTRDRRVISFEQAERMDADPPPDPVGGPRTVEYLTYLGAAAVAVATVALVIRVTFPSDSLLGLLFGSFNNVTGGVVALAGAAIVFATGYRFTRSGGAIGRASGFALLIGYGLAQVGFNLLLLEVDLADATPLVVLLPSAAVAVVAWRRLRCVPTQLALFSVAVSAVGALLVLVQLQDYVPPGRLLTSAAFGAMPPEFSGWITHLAYVALGVAWVWFGSTAFVQTRNTAFFLGSAWAVSFGIALFTEADGWFILSTALTLALFIASVHWRSSVLGAVGAFAGLVLVIQAMTLVHDDISVTAVALWFGIPGILALVGVWVLSLRGSSQPAGAAVSAAPMVGSPTTSDEEE